MSLMPLQAVPVQRTSLGRQASRTADHSAWVPFEGAGAEQSLSWQPYHPFDDAGAGQSLNWRPQIPFEDAGAEQSFGHWGDPFDPFEG